MDDDGEDEDVDEEQSLDIDPYEPAEITESAPSVAAPLQQGTVDSSSHVPVPSAHAESSPVPPSNGVASPVSAQVAATQRNASIDAPIQSVPLAQVKAPPTSNGLIPTPSAVLLKTRLPHDRVGILEDRIKEDPRGDIEAWFDLIKEHKDRNKYQETCRTYDRFFKIFPSAVRAHFEGSTCDFC